MARSRTSRRSSATARGVTAPRWPALLAGAAALACVLVVTAVPVPCDDLFIALAGGRDVLAGRLGAPDDWSFATAGRPWVNQNWGSGVLFYGVHELAGEYGLVALKLALTLAVLAAMTALGRSAGASPAAALLAAATGLLAARLFPELRPNLLTLLFAPLLVVLLRASPRRRWLLAASVGLVGVWANAHGGFMLGLLLLGLWAACCFVAAAWRRGLRTALPLAGPAVVACLAGFTLSGLATPFGWTNLTFSLRLADPAWRTVREWAPLTLSRHELFGSPWEFVAVATPTSIAVAIRLARGVRNRDAVDDVPLAAALFDVAVAAMVAAMAVSAWRFVGVALVVLAPLAAPVADTVLRPERRIWPTLAAVTVLGVVAAPFAGRVARHYRADNPRYAGETTFGRLLQIDTFPTGAARFLADNSVGGRAYNEWRWEGYLRWIAPQVSLFVGGRAHQIYDWPTVARALAVPNGAAPAAELAALGVELVVVPMHQAYDAMVERLALAAGSRWLIVYYDGRDAVLVDTDAAAQRSLGDRARNGGLRYPSPVIAAVSRGLGAACPASGATPAARFDALTKAAREAPTIGVYWAMAALERRGEVDRERLLAFLEREQARLTPLDHRRAGGVDLLKAKWAVAWQLSQQYAAVGRAADAARATAEASALHAELWSVLTW